MREQSKQNQLQNEFWVELRTKLNNLNIKTTDRDTLVKFIRKFFITYVKSKQPRKSN